MLEHAQVAARQGEFATARHLYTTLLARDPGDDEARTGLARLDAWQGEHARAERTYREVLTRHPADDDVRTGLFNVLVWNHRWVDAARLLDAAPCQETPALLGLRARWWYADGDVTKARDLAERAERLAPNDLELRALRQRLFTRSARMTSRLIASGNGAPTLGQTELSLSQAIHRLRLTFDTEQGARPVSFVSGWVYGATYGVGAWWTFAPGLTWGADASFGAPAAVVPVFRVRSQFTMAWRSWFSTHLGYSWRRFANGIDTQTLSPTLGLTLRGEVRIDMTYWLTHVFLSDRASGETSRWVQAFGLSAGRTLLPWFEIRGGYAHGAEAERSPAVFQLLNLVNDSFYVGMRFLPVGFVAIEPLYGLALRGSPGGVRQVQHTFELGFVLKQ